MKRTNRDSDSSSSSGSENRGAGRYVIQPDCLQRIMLEKPKVAWLLDMTFSFIDIAGIDLSTGIVVDRAVSVAVTGASQVMRNTVHAW